ncbi:homoserine kinase [Novosphingobium pentaromativorans]|uniref:Homoserine kinase n=1 Tax=Novosphingobium pentaromativorans US6-1 TaxID=1088721 RepID=G6E8H1_9SPHN|nr:homoserine kinase [Novosphingobium pentaromativorans]AIT81342.1 serine kinase [Novosphingobium pentaromativorans US6-1]EHJ62511.1 homoserine kinase type II [Novosphingobium pentaromativorans US6-1]
MAVYTRLGSEDMAGIIAAFDVGTLVSAKGIAEGVSNSNWLIETQDTNGEARRFILTMYETRTDISDLPFFLGLLDHLAAKQCPVPRTIHDRDGASYRLHEGKALALIEFLPGVSVSEPTAGQARAVGAALAQVHLAAADFPDARENSMGLKAWQELLGACGHDGLESIDPDLARLVEHELPLIASHWPSNLPRGVIHADLFPDNVLMLGDKVTGLIDFYFACTDVTAYDIAVTHAAWCFNADGTHFQPELSGALLEGYEAVRPLLPEERAALPILARAAAMRFLATRAYDLMNTPDDALVTPKDPMAFARRLQFYADAANEGIFVR